MLDWEDYADRTTRRFIDPLCDACVAAMGAAGCLDCVHGGSGSQQQLFNAVVGNIRSHRRTAAALLRSQMYVRGQNTTVQVNLD